jgi:hypothetical protein
LRIKILVVLIFGLMLYLFIKGISTDEVSQTEEVPLNISGPTVSYSESRKIYLSKKSTIYISKGLRPNIDTTEDYYIIHLDSIND